MDVIIYHKPIKRNRSEFISVLTICIGRSGLSSVMGTGDNDDFDGAVAICWDVIHNKRPSLKKRLIADKIMCNLKSILFEIIPWEFNWNVKPWD